jgi:hypothetical protein
MNSVKKDAEGRFTLKEVKTQLDIHEYCKSSFSKFDIQTLQMVPLKILKFSMS